MRRLIPLIAVITVLTGCTPHEIELWQRWHADDPAAAMEYAVNLPPEPEASSPTPGDCDSYAALFERYGLPVATFKRIAWRESGCDHTSFVIDSDDAGGGLLGINLKGRLAATWNEWCGATLGNITDATVNVRCAGEAYDRMGMAPWG
jgi:hypothetical protein